jgi:predicted AAA+ superfamily ATPase
MVASHLYKAIQFWTDRGLGEYGLYYLRDKDKREVDFLVTKDRKPWFLVEAKASGDQGISKSLYYYKEILKVPHAFQIGFDLPYVDVDCFKFHDPVIVPAKTFLSQLI